MYNFGYYSCVEETEEYISQFIKLELLDSATREFIANKLTPGTFSVT